LVVEQRELRLQLIEQKPRVPDQRGPSNGGDRLGEHAVEPLEIPANGVLHDAGEHRGSRSTGRQGSGRTHIERCHRSDILSSN
jgi:hypothetical protein